MEHESIEGGLPSCLKNLKCETLSASELVVQGMFVFPASYCAYDGHFPGQPILPAIVQLAAARYLIESTLQKTLIPAGFSKLKFKGMVQPDDQIVISVTLAHTKCLWQGNVKLQRDSGEILSSGNISYKEDE